MKNILIHIGYHKTGSTWLQKEIFTTKNKKGGNENNLFIPLSLNPNHGQSTLAESFIKGEDGYLLNPFDTNEDNINYLYNKIVSKDKDQDQIYVMSNEKLSSSPHASGFNASVLLHRLSNSFPKAKILIVIREQKSWILSNYFQYLTSGGTHSLEKYLNTKFDGKRPGFSPHHICYHHLIQAYQDRFNKENVLVLPYELFKSDKTAFFQNLSRFLNTKIELNSNQFEVYRNTKKRHYLNYKLRSLNIFLRSSSLNNHSRFSNKRPKNFVRWMLNKLDFFISDKKNEQIQQEMKNTIKDWTGDRFSESNKITSELIDIDLKEYGYS